MSLTTDVPATFPAHDPAGWRQVPVSCTPLDPARVAALMAKEWERYVKATPGSADHAALSSKTLPLGVTSSFQYWDPYPMGVKSARGAYVTDCDDRQVLDLSMGFGAMLVGHLNPTVVAKVKESLDDIGTLFVTPSPISTDVAERFKERFGLDMLRFTNSGTESTGYAVRAARAYTGRKAIVKIEGGYHGGYDGLSVSVKPGLDEIGPADHPIPQVPFDVEPGVVHVVAYNDIGQMQRVLDAHGKTIACVVMEPVIENLGIVLPDAGYLADVRALCDAHNVLLIFDEVKTGLTAGAHGAAARLGVKPDLITLAKSIGGGLPLAAFGGTAEVMQVVVDNRMAHFGTYNGNPLCMAAALAVDEIATPQALAAAEQVNDNAMEAMDTIIREYELPAHTVGFGVKGAVTWSPTPIRNYRDYKLSTDFEAAELGWLWGINRGILTPPGMDDQWLVSLAHTDADMGKWVDAFGELARELRA
ncbi:aminotransferase class III-fold pyridoxal phosphate-dependent enzyme [Mycolicibacterium sp.]|uniref:aspartate aminotransferase family protein n=1 Tax=Mycolicibacterium sp. TaxID=2320850 RepID=UPI001A2F3C8A|nr:aminotransferase class III-fold pyridoxal phosphate-dependent enzyme [Mycolicibacterium sp.]MBJ7399988.1 aminotransferase class III-fold pyridoxal phosphate-dependent enzyme [Mycolicibacterium sp.]